MVNIPVSRYEYHSLNERFYRMEPFEYIDTRLRSLILTISDTVDHDIIWSGNIGYKDVKITNVTTDRKQLDQYAAVESTVILHHACETMLRLYLAHAYRTVCPWLKLSSTISAREFKESIRALGRELKDPVREADILEVFSYTSDPSEFPGITAEAWDSHRKAIVRLLAHAIGEVAGVANAYNAAKHGLAIDAGDLALSFGPTGEEAKWGHSGPALKYLEMGGQKDDRHWQLTSRWVDPVQNIGIIYVVKELVKSLWDVARAHRHIDEPKRLQPLNINHIEHLLTLNQNGFGLVSYSERIPGPEDDEMDDAQTG